MKKSTVFCAAFLSALATPAFADGDGWRFVDGEAVWGFSGGTRDIKMQTREPAARKDFRGTPRTADGWKWVGGEAGWHYVGPRMETRTSTARASAEPSGATR